MNSENSEIVYTVLKLDNEINNPIDKIKINLDTMLSEFIEVTKSYIIQVHQLDYTYIYYSFNDSANIITVHCSHTPMEQYDVQHVLVKELFGDRDLEDYDFIIKFNSDTLECGVCYEDHSKTKFYQCAHSICASCYDQWHARNSTCPTCRQPSLVAINNDGGEEESADDIYDDMPDLSAVNTYDDMPELTEDQNLLVTYLQATTNLNRDQMLVFAQYLETQATTNRNRDQMLEFAQYLERPVPPVSTTDTSGADEAYSVIAQYLDNTYDDMPELETPEPPVSTADTSGADESYYSVVMSRLARTRWVFDDQAPMPELE